jgi:hypothetical protein
MRDGPGDVLIVTEDHTRKMLPTIKKVSCQKKQLILKCLLAPGGMTGEPGDVLIMTEDDTRKKLHARKKVSRQKNPADS